MQRMSKLAIVMAAAVMLVGCGQAPMPNFSTQAGLLKSSKDTKTKERATLTGRDFGQCVAQDSRNIEANNTDSISGFGEVHRINCMPTPEPTPPIQHYM